MLPNNYHIYIIFIFLIVYQEWMYSLFIIILIFCWDILIKFEHYKEMNNKLFGVALLLISRHNEYWRPMIQVNSTMGLYNIITGPIVENVTQELAIKNYVFLINQRNKWIKKYISINCGSNSSKKYCSYPSRINKMLRKKQEFKRKSLYNNHSIVMDNKGIKKNKTFAIKYNILPKKIINGVLIRKFIGNMESSTIYTPDNRILSLDF